MQIGTDQTNKKLAVECSSSGEREMETVTQRTTLRTFDLKWEKMKQYFSGKASENLGRNESWTFILPSLNLLIPFNG